MFRLKQAYKPVFWGGIKCWPHWSPIESLVHREQAACCRVRQAARPLTALFSSSLFPSAHHRELCFCFLTSHHPKPASIFLQSAHWLLWFLMIFFFFSSRPLYLFSCPLCCLGSVSDAVIEGCNRLAEILTPRGNVAFLNQKRYCSTPPYFWGKRVSIILLRFQFLFTQL